MKKYQLIDIEPQPEKIVIKGKEYTINLFSINHNIFFCEKYGADWSNTIRLTSPWKILPEMCYMMMTYSKTENEAKKDFPTLEDFLFSITDFETAKSDMASKILRAWGKSFLEIEVSEEEKSFRPSSVVGKNKTNRKKIFGLF